MRRRALDRVPTLFCVYIHGVNAFIASRSMIYVCPGLSQFAAQKENHWRSTTAGRTTRLCSTESATHCSQIAKRPRKRSTENLDENGFETQRYQSLTVRLAIPFLRHTTDWDQRMDGLDGCHPARFDLHRWNGPICRHDTLRAQKQSFFRHGSYHIDGPTPKTALRITTLKRGIPAPNAQPGSHRISEQSSQFMLELKNDIQPRIRNI